VHYYPWLCDPEPISFRYGDYRPLRKPYLVADYRADSSGCRSSAASTSKRSGIRATRSGK